MAWVSRLIASILVSLIAIALLSQVFDNTLLNSQYLDRIAFNSGTYNQLSVALSDQLAGNIQSQNSTQTSKAQIQESIQKVLTPVVIRAKITQALSGVQAYYKNNGPTPTISLSDLIPQLQAQGIPINPNNETLNKPITLNGYVKIRQDVKLFEQVKLYSLIAAVFLLGLLIFLSWEEHRWKIVPDLFIIIGVLMGVYSVIFLYSIQGIEQITKLNVNANSLSTTANYYAKTLTHHIGITIAIIAIIFLVIGIIVRIIIKVLSKNTLAPLKTFKKSKGQK